MSARDWLTKNIDDAATDFFRDKQGGPVSVWRCWFERILMAWLAVVLIALLALLLVMIPLAVFDIAPNALVTCGMYIIGAAIVPLGTAFVWGIFLALRSALVGPRFCLNTVAYLVLFGAPIFVLDQVLKAPWWSYIAYLAGFLLLGHFLLRDPARRARIEAALGWD